MTNIHPSPSLPALPFGKWFPNSQVTVSRRLTSSEPAPLPSKNQKREALPLLLPLRRRPPSGSIFPTSNLGLWTKHVDRLTIPFSTSGASSTSLWEVLPKFTSSLRADDLRQSTARLPSKNQKREAPTDLRRPTSDFVPGKVRTRPFVSPHTASGGSHFHCSNISRRLYCERLPNLRPPAF